MTKNRTIINYLLLSLCLFLFSSLKLSAGSATMSFSGSSSVYTGNNIEVTLSISNVNAEGGITAIGGQINYDANYLEYVSSQSLSPITVRFEPSTKKFAGLSMGGTPITGSTGVIKLTFKAKQVGSTTVSFSGASISDSLSNSVSVNNPSKTISITNPPSSNTNLGSLSVSGTNISPSNLTANVGKDVSSVTINATAQDGGATVSGTGSKTVNYGKNTYTITVKAPSGATRDYTITINREDPRSNNNNLSSLKVTEGDISPSFKAGTTTYTMTVPFSVSSINVKATAADSKAKVTVTGNTNLREEATTDVLIKVTAENGAVKTYTIKVTREKDPNKPKSNNNYLSSLTTNIGILSPVFDKEKLNYVIYLPFEVDRIELNAEVEDKEYGVLEKSGPETLNVGTNKYTFKVTAEDGTSKEYVVNVIRGVNVESSSSNIYLKEINMTNGSLDKKFNREINVYRYEKKKDFKINPEPEDENTKMTVIEHDDVITILLENSSGESNVYTFIPKEEAISSSNLGTIVAIAISIPLIGGGTFVGYRVGLKNKEPKIKIKKDKIKKGKNKEVEIPRYESKIEETNTFENETKINEDIE